MRILKTLISSPAAMLAGAVLTGLLPASCTVKEDRNPCPCYLNVSFADRGSIPEGAVVDLLGWQETEMFRVGINVSDYDPYWVRGVRKGYFLLSAYRGVKEVTDRGRIVTITPGNQSDSLYAYHTEVDATGDMAYAEVTFRKQFCTVHLNINKTSAQMRSYRFLIEGNTCGFDLFDFKPVPGAFRYEPEMGSSTVVDFRVPRQADDSMTARIWYRHDDGAFENIGVFPLGRYIAKTGYVWSSEELQDVFVSIDLVNGLVIIGVEGWEEGAVFSFIEQ